MLTVLPAANAGTQDRRFTLVTLLGRGSFGEVHLALMHHPTGMTRQVALKLLRVGLDPRDQAQERLLDEAKLLASLHHPVILTAHDLIDFNGRMALVTEFIEGEDLSSCLKGSPPMPVGPLLEVVEQVASALDAAWRQLGVVHRDIKPQNIRIGRHGNVKLLDFGIASSQLEDRAAHSTPEMLLGTPRYLAPERLCLDERAEPTADIFSLGCVLYEGLVGRSVFHKMHLLDIYRLSAGADGWDSLIERQLDNLPPLGPIAHNLRRLMSEMLAYDPTIRPPADEVVRRCAEMSACASSPIGLARFCRDRFWLKTSPINEDELPTVVAPTARVDYAPTDFTVSSLCPNAPEPATSDVLGGARASFPRAETLVVPLAQVSLPPLLLAKRPQASGVSWIRLVLAPGLIGIALSLVFGILGLVLFVSWKLGGL